jgi:ABC-type transporter Mla subunit MlaD
MNDRALTYLQGDSYGQKRDLIARCYYQVAQGDPDSGPVTFAVLIRAGAEQFAKTPQELADITASFQKVVADAADVERRMIERVDRNNVAVVAGFKDETRRATDTLQDIVGHSNITLERTKKIEEKLKPLVADLERIADKVYLLNENLRDNHEAATKTAETAEKIQNVYETTLEPVKGLTRDVRFLLASGGFLGGMLFDQLADQTELLPWTGLVALLLILGWIQYLLRKSWKGVRWLAEKWRSSLKS